MGNTQNWHQDACLDYETTNMSVLEISRKYGRSPGTINKLVSFHQLTAKVPKKKGRAEKWTEKKPLSPTHFRIGNMLNHHRQIELGWSVNDFAREMRLSWIVLRRMELGQHDFTLNELRRISDLIKVPIDALVHSTTTVTLPNVR